MAGVGRCSRGLTHDCFGPAEQGPGGWMAAPGNGCAGRCVHARFVVMLGACKRAGCRAAGGTSVHYVTQVEVLPGKRCPSHDLILPSPARHRQVASGATQTSQQGWEGRRRAQPGQAGRPSTSTLVCLPPHNCWPSKRKASRTDSTYQAPTRVVFMSLLSTPTAWDPCRATQATHNKGRGTRA